MANFYNAGMKKWHFLKNNWKSASKMANNLTAQPLELSKEKKKVET
jgi:hypothetical protein